MHPLEYPNITVTTRRPGASSSRFFYSTIVSPVPFADEDLVDLMAVLPARVRPAIPDLASTLRSGGFTNGSSSWETDETHAIFRFVDTVTVSDGTLDELLFFPRAGPAVAPHLFVTADPALPDQMKDEIALYALFHGSSFRDAHPAPGIEHPGVSFGRIEDLPRVSDAFASFESPSGYDADRLLMAAVEQKLPITYELYLVPDEPREAFSRFRSLTTMADQVLAQLAEPKAVSEADGIAYVGVSGGWGTSYFGFLPSAELRRTADLDKLLYLAPIDAHGNPDRVTNLDPTLSSGVRGRGIAAYLRAHGVDYRDPEARYTIALPSGRLRA